MTVQLLAPSKDQVIYDVPVEGTVPMVFSVVKKRLHKSVYADNNDLTNLGNKFSREGLSDSYVVFAENQESVDYVLDSTMLEVLNKYPCVQQIFITDQKSLINTPLTVRLIHDSVEDDPEQLININKSLLHLVDRLAVFSLSTANRTVALKEREIIHEITNKENQ